MYVDWDLRTVAEARNQASAHARLQQSIGGVRDAGSGQRIFSGDGGVSAFSSSLVLDANSVDGNATVLDSQVLECR